MPTTVAWLPPEVEGSLLTLDAPPGGMRPKWLLPGAPGKVLRISVGGTLEWGDPPIAPLPITAPGDLITGDGAGVAVRLPRGAPNQMLTVASGGLLTWAAQPVPLPTGTLGGLMQYTTIWESLGPGAAGQILTMVGGAPVWSAPPTGFPTGAIGALPVYDTPTTLAPLAPGTDGQILAMVSGSPAWQAAPAALAHGSAGRDPVVERGEHGGAAGRGRGGPDPHGQSGRAGMDDHGAALDERPDRRAAVLHLRHAGGLAR